MRALSTIFRSGCGLRRAAHLPFAVGTTALRLTTPPNADHRTCRPKLFIDLDKWKRGQWLSTQSASRKLPVPKAVVSHRLFEALEQRPQPSF